MAFKSLIFAFAFLFSSFLYAAGNQAWVEWRRDQSIQRILNNISPAGAAAGAVIASPEKTSPPYYYHWVRDAALTMNTVFDLYLETQGSDKAKYKKLMMDFINFSHMNQQSITLTGLGEPKFFPDGQVFNEGWCRPQNDGPALRASVLIRFAHAQIKQKKQVVGQSVIKADLDYVAAHA